jgi:hypothetical protein
MKTANSFGGVAIPELASEIRHKVAGQLIFLAAQRIACADVFLCISHTEFFVGTGPCVACLFFRIAEFVSTESDIVAPILLNKLFGKRTIPTERPLLVGEF